MRRDAGDVQRDILVRQNRQNRKYKDLGSAALPVGLAPFARTGAVARGIWGEQHRGRNRDGKDAQVIVTDIGAFRPMALPVGLASKTVPAMFRVRATRHSCCGSQLKRKQLKQEKIDGRDPSHIGSW